MMRRRWLLVSALCLLTSCAADNTSLPTLSQISNSSAECPSLFPKGNYQFVHLIEFSMPGGRHGSAMGVTIVRGNTIESVLMTVEGFVLFAAKLTDKLTITRAVPPFDKPGFAQGMMQDIQTIFLPPEGKPVQGTLPDNGPICRSTDSNGTITDIIPTADHCLQLNLYSPQHQLARQITGNNCNQQLGTTWIPGSLQLTAHQSGGYSLHMTLISAKQIDLYYQNLQQKK
jgi:hypothetical protein